MSALDLEKDVSRICDLLSKLEAIPNAPVQKMASLRDILQSEFFSAVRQVYEHIYQSLPNDGPEDVKAATTGKACVAVFAAGESSAHPRIVELPKTGEGLGFNIMGGKEQNSPIFISRIIPGGLAHRLDTLKRGDQLFSVDGVNVEGENHETAVELLKAAKGSVKLVVCYTPKLLEEIEKRFYKR